MHSPGRRVLLIERDPLIREGACALLQAWSFEVVAGADPASALRAAAETGAPHFAIVAAPEGDAAIGAVWVEALEAYGDRLPVILVAHPAAGGPPPPAGCVRIDWPIKADRLRDAIAVVVRAADNWAPGSFACRSIDATGSPNAGRAPAFDVSLKTILQRRRRVAARRRPPRPAHPRHRRPGPGRGPAPARPPQPPQLRSPRRRRLRLPFPQERGGCEARRRHGLQLRRLLRLAHRRLREALRRLGVALSALHWPRRLAAPHPGEERQRPEVRRPVELPVPMGRRRRHPRRSHRHRPQVLPERGRAAHHLPLPRHPRRQRPRRPGRKRAKLYDAVASTRKTLKIFTTSDGGGEHAYVDNRQVGIDFATDWLGDNL